MNNGKRNAREGGEERENDVKAQSSVTGQSCISPGQGWTRLVPYSLPLAYKLSWTRLVGEPEQN
jgi:hypothetical protein